jgi:RNA polymerase sigma-70 factor (ECF subfamily)
MISSSPEAAQAVAEAVLPHLEAAYNLARWLAGDDHDAQDVVQEAYLRAIRGAATYRGNDARVWLLAIVRNTAIDWLRRCKSRPEENLIEDPPVADDSKDFNPQAILLRAADIQLVRDAIDSLPPDLREVVVLREMEGLSYKEIAMLIGSPIGTVMSRLSRGRIRLQQLLSEEKDASLGAKAEP